MFGLSMSQALKNNAHIEGKRAVPLPDCPFLSCVDDALCVFGDSAKHAIYYYLDKDHNLAREMIPVKPELFEDVMKKIFGEGAKIILHLVVKYSYTKAGLEPPPPQEYHPSDLRKISSKLSEVYSSKRKECPVEKCVYFDEDREEKLNEF